MTEEYNKTKELTKEATKEVTKEATKEATQATPGQQLKKGREAMGLTQQQVADRLHLRLGNIQDIETDTHKAGVSITFTKGYVRIYAKLLSMPVDPLLENFDVLHKGEKQPAKLQSFSQRVAKQANDDRWMMVTYLIVFLVVASLVIWWYQQSDKSIMNRLNLFNNNVTEQSNKVDEGESVNAMTNNPNMPDELAISEEDIKSQNAMTNTDSTLDTQTQNSENITDSDASEGEQAKTLDKKNTELANQSSDSDNPIVAESDIKNPMPSISSRIIDGYTINSNGTVDVIFTFKEDCWLSVKDANDEVMALGVKVKGRVMSVRGTPPISVNMCPPQTVDIDFAGAPVDLSSYPRGIPVKFELSITGE
jgi:cytoskeleton protein RodZ